MPLAATVSSGSAEPSWPRRVSTILSWSCANGRRGIL